MQFGWRPNVENRRPEDGGPDRRKLRTRSQNLFDHHHESVRAGSARPVQQECRRCELIHSGCSAPRGADLGFDAADASDCKQRRSAPDNPAPRRAALPHPMLDRPPASPKPTTARSHAPPAQSQRHSIGARGARNCPFRLADEQRRIGNDGRHRPQQGGPVTRSAAR